MVIPGHNLVNSQVSVNRTIGPTLVYIEPGSVKLSDIFSFAEWTKRVLSGFVYNFYM